MTGVRVPPWTGRVARQPTVRLSAPCRPEQLVDAVARAARSRRFAVHATGPGRLVLSRGIKGGDLISEVIQLPLWTVLQRVEVEVEALPAAPAAALRVTCTTGVRGLTVATKVARVLDDAVRGLERAGVPVRVEGWYADPEELDPAT